MAILLKNCFLAGKTGTADILAKDGKETFSTIDCTGLTILPGLVDVHVHFRQPGFEYKETIRTGSMAAARGGYTTVCTMPNLNPAPDSLEHLKVQQDAISRDAVVKVLPYATITRERKGIGELTDHASFEAENIAGFSDDGCGVQTSDLMEEAMVSIARTGRILAEHCEMPQYGTGAESEWREIERNIALCEKTGCPLHICHISTKESVQLIRDAKARGVDVTCETGPHYLLLCADDVQDDGRFRMNPPIREREDMMALRQGLQDGTIDMIATDHAPHSAEEKSRGLKGSAMGIVGLESAFQVLYTSLVEPGIISLEKLVDLMSIAPRKRFHLEDSVVTSSEGCADLVAVALSKSTVIDPSRFASMGHSTPFEGWAVKSEIAFTMVDGKIVYKR